MSLDQMLPLDRNLSWESSLFFNVVCHSSSSVASTSLSEDSFNSCSKDTAKDSKVMFQKHPEPLEQQILDKGCHYSLNIDMQIRALSHLNLICLIVIKEIQGFSVMCVAYTYVDCKFDGLWLLLLHEPSSMIYSQWHKRSVPRSVLRFSFSQPLLYLYF